ncbi:phage tail protein [Acinetobacter johnsonii]|uniref:phage tail-collar fiber domain-containing protein n=1 Tax=Acinetobacter johnsonii TaxID=40214 RepID=UPI0024486292|nr:phage tail protein [Acinetobacter johnsonii]MDH1699666.1 phage tail protein [Acinetobacter johnsonii]
MSEYFNVTTNVGDAAIATAIANNSKLNITHIAFGDGNGSVPTPTKTRTSLVREVHRQAVTKYAMHPTIANYIVIETIIPSNIGGFWIREMGIIADNVLISHGSHAPFFKVADPDGVSEYRLKFTQNVRDGNVVEISLDESLIYASQAWVEENFIKRNEIVDNLTTDDATKPVSAKQAKKLQDSKLGKTENATSATKLAVARNIGGVAFDGTKNIDLPGVNAMGNQDSTGSSTGSIMVDNRIIKPIDLKPNSASLFFTTQYGLNNPTAGESYGDFIALNGWNDSSGGNKNGLFFAKDSKRIYHYQADYNAAEWGTANKLAYTTDNVASATKLNTPRNVFGQTFDGTGDVGGTVTASTGLVQTDSFHYIDMGRTGLDRMNFYNYGAIFNFIDSAIGNVVARITPNGIDCNAASASKLKVPRKINNVDFDGTSDITVTDDALTYMPIPYPKSSPPTGYLAMMGQAISESTYPKLYALYGAVLPDMRAYSVRGLDYGRGIDVGRTVLSQQEDAIRNITGSLITGFLDAVGVGGAFAMDGTTSPNGAGVQGLNKKSATFDASRVVPVAAENRIKNIAFLYIVKAG